MPEKPFTKYLLKLATDADEVGRLRAGGDPARTSMAAAGLTDRRLQDILLDGNQEKIDAAVAAEVVVVDVPAGVKVIPARIVSLVQVQTKPPPAE